MQGVGVGEVGVTDWRGWQRVHTGQEEESGWVSGFVMAVEQRFFFSFSFLYILVTDKKKSISHVGIEESVRHVVDAVQSKKFQFVRHVKIRSWFLVDKMIMNVEKKKRKKKDGLPPPINGIQI